MLAAVALDAAACYVLSGALGARNDLFPRWMATRLWVTDGHDLYSPATDAAIRAAMGPVPLGSEAFVFGFVYPAYVALVLVPFALMPLRVAATVWLLLIQLSAVGGALLAWRACERERGLAPATPLPALAVATLLPATVIHLLFLQFSAPVFGALAVSWWLSVRGREGGAAAALLATCLKPQVGMLPALAVLGRAAAQERWRFVLTAVGGAVALVTVSVLVMPGWIERFLASAQAYAAESHPASAAALIGSEPWLSALIGASALALVGGTWWRSARSVGDTLAAAILLTAWLVPPLYEWNNVLLLLVLVPALRVLTARRAAYGWLGGGLLVAASVVTYWAIAIDPNASRAIWPTIALVVYLATSLLGSQRLTSSAPSPAVPRRA